MVITGQAVIFKKRVSAFLLFTNVSFGSPGKEEGERGFFPKAKLGSLIPSNELDKSFHPEIPSFVLQST